MIRTAAYVFGLVGLLCILSVRSAQASPRTWEHLDLSRYEPTGEPAEHAPAFQVYFMINDNPIDAPYTVLAGQAISQEQWPPAPTRTDYTFVGWYDNPERSGSPYAPDAAIHDDMEFYAGWQYSGGGGCWPRPRRGVISGIESGAYYDIDQSLSITVAGHNMHLTSPNDQRFRWQPIYWRVSDATSGDFSQEAPFQAAFSLSDAGDYLLYVTYKEQVFDGIHWQETGQVHEVEEVSFQIQI